MKTSYLTSIRCLVAPSIKSELDHACKELRDKQGYHHGETMGALLVLGLRAYRRTGAVYPSVVKEALNG